MIKITQVQLRRLIHEVLEEAPVRIEPGTTGDIHYSNDTEAKRRKATADQVRNARRNAQGTTKASGEEGDHVGVKRRPGGVGDWTADTDVAVDSNDQDHMSNLSAKLGLPKSAKKYAKRAKSLNTTSSTVEKRADEADDLDELDVPTSTHGRETLDTLDKRHGGNKDAASDTLSKLDRRHGSVQKEADELGEAIKRFMRQER